MREPPRVRIAQRCPELVNADALDGAVRVADVRHALREFEFGRILVLADVDELPGLLQGFDEQPRLFVLVVMRLGGRGRHDGLSSRGVGGLMPPFSYFAVIPSQVKLQASSVRPAKAPTRRRADACPEGEQAWLGGLSGCACSCGTCSRSGDALALSFHPQVSG